MTERILIVGGGAAGHAAARAYRDAGGAGTVALITDDDRPPYNRPPLSKEFLRGEQGEDALELGELDRVEILYGHAAALDTERRRVELDDGRRLDYTGCLLATGAEPVRLPLDGGDRAHVLRTVRDAQALAAAVTPGVSAAVIGTGFIGCEAAASLAMRGARVTVYGMDAVPQAERLGEDAGRRLAGWLGDCGCELVLGAGVEALPDADVVVMATGIAPRSELAERAGPRMGDGGKAIAADGAQRTTADGVFAAGDVCEAQHPVAGRPLRVEHWGDALAQGWAAGRRLAGDETAAWDSVPGFWSTIGERTLKYAAWGDGWADARFVEHPGGAWTVWYAGEDGECVGVLTHDRDEDYDRGKDLIAAAERAPT